MPDSYDAMYDRLERVRQDYMKLDAKHHEMRRDALDQIHQLELAIGDPDCERSVFLTRLGHLRDLLSGTTLVCPDCGGPGVTWEEGYVLCDACARKRAIAAKNARIDGADDAR